VLLLWPGRAHGKGMPVRKESRRKAYLGTRDKGVRKRRTLGKDSVLGSRDKVDMLDVDLGRLVGGKSCSILCTIFRNGFQVLSFALANTRTNAFTLVDTKCAQKLSKYLGTLFEKLTTPI
jgi:hypothetical protein